MKFLLKNQSLLLLWLGQILSQSGGRMYQIAMIWWLLNRHPESSGKWIGAFLVLSALPSLLLVKRIGHWVDFFSSRSILITCDCVASAVVAGVSLYLLRGDVGNAWVFVAGLLAATLQATIDPTLNKAVGNVVEPADYEPAVALLASTQSLANFSGAVAGALLIDRLGVAGTAGLASVGYLISAICSSRVLFRLPAQAAEASVATTSLEDVFRNIPWLKRILFGFAATNFFATPTLVVLPIYVKTTLGGSAALLGKMEAALWSGLLAGTFLARWIPSKDRIRLGSVCLLGFGLALVVPSQWVSPYVYGASLFVGCAAIGINNVKFMSLFQERVPMESKGRFFALLQGMIGFTFPIAFFLFGFLTDIASARWVCLIQGLGVLAVAVYFASQVEREVDKTELEEVGRGELWGY